MESLASHTPSQEYREHEATAQEAKNLTQLNLESSVLQQSDCQDFFVA